MGSLASASSRRARLRPVVVRTVVRVHAEGGEGRHEHGADQQPDDDTGRDQRSQHDQGGGADASLDEASA